jgi:aspartate/methionine/tyrosine aminotransferase
MSRLELNHIAWSKATPGRLTHDLSEAAIAAPDLAELGLPHVTGMPRDAVGTQRQLESALGARVGAPFGRVLVTAGASEAIATVFAGLTVAGDGVLVERPGYEPHRSVAKRFGAKLRTFVRPRDRGFGGVAFAVQEQITKDTRMVVISHLHNPSGAPLEDADAEALNELAERHGLWIVCDEALRDASERLPMGTVAARGPRWVSISSLSKAYGLGGLRIGWIAAGADALGRCADAQNALSVNPASPSVALALALVPQLDALRDRCHRMLRANHARWWELVMGLDAAATGGLDCGRAPHGTTTWAMFPGDTQGDEFAALTATRYDLAVTPGGFFGDSRGIRIGLGGEPDRFAAALEAFGKALEAHVAERIKMRANG